jgi:uncharacterized surface protein with fasciclin (FAS1) repeats
LLQQTKFWDLLNSDEPYTVFAPTNAAFANLRFGEISDGQLVELLSYHIAPGYVPSWDFFPCYRSMAHIYTVQGSSLFVDVDIVDDMEYPTINHAVLTTTRDVFASNGVVHVIDDLLMPPQNLSLGQTLQSTPTASSFGTTSTKSSFQKKDVQ